MKTTWRVFWIVTAVLIMGVIFYFSSQNTGISEDLSDTVAEVLSIEQKQETVRASNQGLFLGLTLRKLAHIVLFAGLGFSLFMAFTAIKGRTLWTLGIAYLYGVLDELHQTASGRYGRWQDTLIDLLGALLGLLCCWVILKIWKKLRQQTIMNNGSNTVKETKGEKFLQKTEWIAIIVVMHYCVLRFLESTAFHFEFSKLYNTATLASLVLVGSPRLLAGLWKEYKDHGITKGLIAKLLLIAASGISSLIVELKFDYTFFIYLVFSAFCLYGIDSSKVLKVFVITIGTMFAATIICCLSGVIENYIYLTPGSFRNGLLRSSYGIAYPTDFASYLVFLLLFFWCGGKRKPFLPVLGMLALTLWFIYNYTNSNSSEICLILLAVLIIYEAIEHRFLQSHTKWTGFTGGVAASAFPILGIIFCILTWLYGNGNAFARQVDTFVHGRFGNPWGYYLNSGIQAFGMSTNQNGFGGGDIAKWTMGPYDFLDSTYGLFLIRYGWVITLIVTILWVYMARKAIKNRNRTLAFAMAVIAVHAFSEHHFPEINYNILLAMPLCRFTKQEEQAVVQEEVQSRKLTWIPWAISAVMVALCAVFAPTILSHLRTVFELTGGNKLVALFFSLFLIILIGALIWSLSWMIKTIVEKESIKKPIVSVATMIVLLIGTAVYSNIIIGTGVNSPRLSADASAVETILSTATEPVYASTQEELYKRNHSGISSHIWTLEEMARLRQGTIITDREPEANKLIATGAIYAEISDYSSIYTYDWSLAKALKELGYTCHAYYYTKRTLNNSVLAGLNHLVQTETGALMLDAGRSITKEPGLSLYGGSYRIEWDITADPVAISAESNVCILTISAGDGKRQLWKKEISAKEFDEAGRFLSIQEYGIGANTGIRFEVKALEPIQVNNIAWSRVTSTDTWRKYDTFGRVTEEQYYTNEGETLVQVQGYAGLKYTYPEDRDNLVNAFYLDASGNSTMIAGECAEIQREYNRQGKVTRETYMGNEGQSIERTGGYSSIEQDYNDTGRLIARKYLNKDRQLTNRTDGYSEVRWVFNETTRAYDVLFYDKDGRNVDSKGINLACDVPGDTENWSAWLHPVYNTVNSCISIGSFNLGNKSVGDIYACQIEIEFKDVKASDGQQIRFWTQGSADGKWDKGNVWASNLVYMETSPQNGIYTYSVTNAVNENMLNVSSFDMGFRCDYWASGCFRVRKVKVELGNTVSEWTPGI